MASVGNLKEENEKLKQDSIQLLNAIVILKQSRFDDCFQFLCKSKNECQLCGCKTQLHINKLKHETNF